MKKIILFFLLFKLTLFQCQENIVNDLDLFENVLYSNKDSALFLINRATQNSIRTKNWFLYSRCLYKNAYLKYTQNRLDDAKTETKKSINLCKSVKNQKTLSACYNLLGSIDMNKGKYNESLKNLLISLKIAEKNKLPLNTCIALNQLGNLYSIQNDTIKALNYYLKTIKIATENDLKTSLLDAYNNTALIQASSNKLESIENYNKALLLANELNNKDILFSIYINLSSIYIKSSPQKGLNYIIKAKQNAEELNDENKLFYVYFNLGAYYFQKKDFQKAIENYGKAEVLSKNVDEEQIKNLYESYRDSYIKIGDYKNAYLYQSRFYTTQNKLFGVDKTKDFNEIQTRYEVDKKNLKIKILNKEKQIELEKKERLVLIILIVIGLLIFVFITFKQRVKSQKRLLEKEHLIHEQEKIALQKDSELKQIKGEIEGQDKERHRIASEIHDGVGGKLAFIKHSLKDINNEINNEKISDSILHIDSLFSELRTISHNLSNNFIKNRRFEDLLREFQILYKPKFSVELIVYPQDLFEKIPDENKHHIYRIIQELLANVSKHSHATEVSLYFTKNKNSLNILVEDNGIGFSNFQIKGIGLKNIEERVSLLNGSMKIESTKGHGSTITIDLKTNY